MTTTALWLTILAIGVLTFGIRLSFIALTDRIALPPFALRVLRFVPVAVLTAIIVPELVLPSGALDLSLNNARLIAGALAVVVAWRTRNIALTLVVGMVALWLLQFVLHAQ